MIRVLLAEDQAMIRGALLALIGLEHDMTVVADVERGDEVVGAARKTRPDVAVLDIDMPGIDGLSAAAILRDELPETRILILTGLGQPGHLTRALEARVGGFMKKDAPSDELADAIRRVAKGQRFLDPDLVATALEIGTSPLTAREAEVLRVAADGGRPRRSASRSTSHPRPSATTCRARSPSSAPATGSTRSGSRARPAGSRRRRRAAPRGDARASGCAGRRP